MNKQYYELGQKIRNFRIRFGKSQMELELEIGASAGSISRIENGEVNPTKETLIKIIEALKLSTYDSSALFDIDVNSEVEKLLDISKQLSSNNDLDYLLNLITTDLIKYVKGEYSVIFLYNKSKSSLKVASLNVPSLIRKVCSKFLGYPIDTVEFRLNNKEDLKNLYVKSFLTKSTMETQSVYEASYPLLHEKLAGIVQEIANSKLIISEPIIYNNKSIGILGIVFKRSEISDNDRKVIKNFNDLISSTIYRFIDKK